MLADVIVLGGGPAGCAAALTLRAAGIATTMISVPRPREKPTETSVPRLRWLLRSLGADAALAACEPCHGIESNWGALGPALQPGILDPSGHAWFIHRGRFDAALLRLVDAAGARRLAAEAQSVDFTADGVVVSTTAGPVSAGRLVIATGSPAWAARVTGQKPVTLDSLVCHWSRLPVALESRLLHVEAGKEGWWYLCPGEAGTTIACFLTDAEGTRRLAPSDPAHWNALLRGTRLGDRLDPRVRAGEIQSILVGVSGLARRRGPRWVAAGDAALKLDPIGSSGVATALESGALAARALLDDDADGQRHERWGDGLLAAFLKRRAPLYAAEAAKHPDGFWTRRN